MKDISSQITWGLRGWTYLVVPCLFVVVDHSRPEAPGRVDSGASDRDCGQVDHEHGKTDRQRYQHLSIPHTTTQINVNNIDINNSNRDQIVSLSSQSAYRNVGIPGVPLGVSGREHGVDENEGADDLHTETGALAVATGELVGTAAVLLIVGPLEGLHEAAATDCTEALGRHVQDGSHQGHLPCQEQPECHRRVYVPAWIIRSISTGNECKITAANTIKSNNKWPVV